METRREFLRLISGALGVGACQAALGQPAEYAVYIGVETSATTGHSTARLLAASGETLGRISLNYRAHGMASHGQQLVVFPRRPGNRFAVVDMATLQIQSVVTAPEDRHFYGHGAYSADGQWLLVTENDLASLEGRIGVYSMADGPRREGETALPGPGPHEIIRGRDGDFFVALGGLETHPDYGRTPLNLNTYFKAKSFGSILRKPRSRNSAPCPTLAACRSGTWLRTGPVGSLSAGKKRIRAGRRRQMCSGQLTMVEGKSWKAGTCWAASSAQWPSKGVTFLFRRKKVARSCIFAETTVNTIHEIDGASGLGFLGYAPVLSSYATVEGLAQPVRAEDG